MDHIVGPDDRILVTGAAGFIGSRVVERLLDRGFRNVRCFAQAGRRSDERLDALHRPSRERASRSVRRESAVAGRLQRGGQRRRRHPSSGCRPGREVLSGRVHELGRHDAQPPRRRPAARLPAAVRQRQLLRGLRRHSPSAGGGCWTNRARSSRIPSCRGDAYSFAKVKQDELVAELRRAVRHPVRHRQAGLRVRPRQRGDHRARRNRHLRHLSAPRRRRTRCR